jgi:hypothetical protein
MEIKSGKLVGKIQINDDDHKIKRPKQTNKQTNKQTKRQATAIKIEKNRKLPGVSISIYIYFFSLSLTWSLSFFLFLSPARLSLPLFLPFACFTVLLYNCTVTALHGYSCIATLVKFIFRVDL